MLIGVGCSATASDSWALSSGILPEQLTTSSGNEQILSSKVATRKRVYSEAWRKLPLVWAKSGFRGTAFPVFQPSRLLSHVLGCCYYVIHD